MRRAPIGLLCVPLILAGATAGCSAGALSAPIKAAAAAGEPPVVATGSPFTVEQFGLTPVDLTLRYRECRTVMPPDASPAVAAYVNATNSALPGELLLTLALDDGPADATERAEQLRLDTIKLAAIKADPELAKAATALIRSVSNYDKVLTISKGDKIWQSNAPVAHAYNNDRSAASQRLRAALHLPPSACAVRRP
ncbi:hypothetical protein [Angustibacter luteus]|uniref:Uncharacterized protein n=1 Tax=Angustibacter luteus TaxID=658456 RepID=A0ABW1JES9_9ACTN